jgi:hypothetical protein
MHIWAFFIYIHRQVPQGLGIYNCMRPVNDFGDSAAAFVWDKSPHLLHVCVCVCVCVCMYVRVYCAPLHHACRHVCTYRYVRMCKRMVLDCTSIIYVNIYTYVYKYIYTHTNEQKEGGRTKRLTDGLRSQTYVDLWS